MESQPAWYPDPLGRHDHRWFDGTRWTADVADDGVRHVDPIGSTSRQPGRRRRGLRIAVIVGMLAASAPLVMLWRAVSKFAHPAGHTVAIADCSLAAGTVRVDVSVENQSDSPAAFTVFVEVIGPVLNRTIRTLTIAIPTVPAGSVADGSATFPSSVESVDCHIVAVGGPLPFGVDIGPVGVQG